MDALQTVEHWQAKLSAARAELADFEASLGARALSEDAGTLASELSRLRDAVTITEAAYTSAVAAAPDPRITQKRAQLTRAQTELAAVNAECAKWEAVLAEFQPRVNEALNQGMWAAKRAMTLEHNVINLGNELQALERGER